MFNALYIYNVKIMLYICSYLLFYGVMGSTRVFEACGHSSSLCGTTRYIQF